MPPSRLLTIAPRALAQSTGSLSPALIPYPGLECDVSAGNPHISGFWEKKGGLKVDTHTSSGHAQMVGLPWLRPMESTDSARAEVFCL